MKRNENLPLNFIDKMNSRLSMIVACAVLALVCLLFNRLDYHMIRKPLAQERETETELKESRGTGEGERTAYAPTARATILAVGDNLVQGELLSQGQSGDAWDYSGLYEQAARRISAADLAIVTQETPFTASHGSASNVLSPTEVGDALAGAGFDVFALATEYMAGSGEDAVRETLAFFEGHPGVKGVGVQEAGGLPYQVMEVNGIKIAVLNYVMPIIGQTVRLGEAAPAGAASGTVPEYYWDDDDEVYYVYDEEEDSWYASETEPTAGSSSAEGTETASDTGGGSDTLGAYTLNVLDQAEVSSAISQAKAAGDAVIFCAHWGRDNEPMPTEYQKEWANYLLQQGVDVLIGSYPSVLSPYCTLVDDNTGHSMLVYYSLGNFLAAGDTLKQLIGGMATFTISKTGDGQITVSDADLELLTTHYDGSGSGAGTYLVSDYSGSLAQGHSFVTNGSGDFGVSQIQTKADEILSMLVEPSTATTMLDYQFDSSGNLYDANGGSVTDTDSITSVQYYENLG